MTAPNRPTSDEFLTLSQIARDYDAASSDGIGIERLIRHAFEDIDTVTYMSQQRAASLLAATAMLPPVCLPSLAILLLVGSSARRPVLAGWRAFFLAWPWEWRSGWVVVS